MAAEHIKTLLANAELAQRAETSKEILSIVEPLVQRTFSGQADLAAHLESILVSAFAIDTEDARSILFCTWVNLLWNRSSQRTVTRQSRVTSLIFN